jgi:5-formyltetrahydrofolate cyclo-ligase
MNPEKAAIRKHIRALRDAVAAEQRAAWTQRICEKALALPEYQSACVIHIFLSFQSEVDTRAIIERAFAQGKRVVVPVFLKDSDETPCTHITSLDEGEFNSGKWGLRTPKAVRLAPIEEIDLVFAPMVAFASPLLLPRSQGAVGWGRIGYGAGFYDRFLKRIRHGVPKIGLAFSMQRVEAIPVEWFDVLLDDVITEV